MKAVPVALNTLVVAADSLAGWNLNGGGATATLTLRKKKAAPGDADNSGAVLAIIQVPANETDSFSFGAARLYSPGGIYCEDTAGSMAGVLYVG